MAYEPHNEKDTERLDMCRFLAAEIFDFAIITTKKEGLEPVDMLVALSAALVEANIQYSKKGMEGKSFEVMIETLKTIHDFMMNKNKEEVELEEAVEEAFQARIRGAMQ